VTVTDIAAVTLTRQPGGQWGLRRCGWLKTKRNIVAPGDNARVELKPMNLAEADCHQRHSLCRLVWERGCKEDDITTVSTAVTVEASGSLILNWRVPDDVKGACGSLTLSKKILWRLIGYANLVAASDDTISARYQGVEIITDQTRHCRRNGPRNGPQRVQRGRHGIGSDTGGGELHKRVLPPHRTEFITIPITERFVLTAWSTLWQCAIPSYREVELICSPTKERS